MGSSRLSPSKRREEVRAHWRAHVEAQGASGQTQTAYCREHGLEPKYFSVWKGKLKRFAHSASTPPAVTAATDSAVQLVPLIIKRTSDTDLATADSLTLHVKLANGLSVAISLPDLRS